MGKLHPPGDSGNDESVSDPDEVPSGAKPSEVELTVQQRQPQKHTSLERTSSREQAKRSGATGQSQSKWY